MIQKERVVKTRSTQDIEKLINKLTSGKTYTMSNNTNRRNLDAKNDTIGDLANTLATLISDLKEKGIIQK